MLVKLLQEQTAKYWPFIKHGIQECTPVETLKSGEVLNNILEALMNEEAQCWLSVTLNEEVNDYDINAFVITSRFKDTTFGVFIFRILYIYGFTRVPMEEWPAGWDTLIQFATRSGCKIIDGFTENEFLIGAAKKVGMKTQIHISKEI